MRCLRVLIAVSLAWIAVPTVALATTLEQEYVATPGWCPGLVVGNVQTQHHNWHMMFFGASQGREFVEFHREFVAQSDDFRLYGFDTPAVDVDPDPAAIAVVAQPGSALKYQHTSLNGYARAAGHVVGALHPHPGGGLNSAWTVRPANLRLGNVTFHGYNANGIGTAMDGLFHGGGHMTIALHDFLGISGDMGNTLDATRDGAFFQWHKNIDEIYAEWAVGQYQLSNKSGLPIYFSVGNAAVGAAGTSLNDRRQSDVYQASNPPLANQYGAIPRIASDIYVGNTDGKNLLYRYGVRKWQTLNAWDIDAFAILKPPGNGWYFSVNMASAGAPGSAVAAQAVKGGNVFQSGGGGANALFRTAANLGLTAAASDELDALVVDEQRRVQATNDSNKPGIYTRSKQWFSLRAGSTFGIQALGGAAIGASDILRITDQGDLVIDVAGAVLGLGAGDDLDALAIVDVDGSDTLTAPDRIYYSLAAGSPALAANSPADVFCHTVAGVPCGAMGGRLEITAANLGLLATDELDALDVRLAPTGVGACCGQSGNCTLETQADCTLANGSFNGLETVCSGAECPSDIGACCHPSGMCTPTSDRGCLDEGGTFLGVGVSCSMVCSLSHAPCVTDVDCLAGGGGVCTAGADCHAAPGNDECNGAYPIPYDYGKGYRPPADNTYATPASYDPPYGCYDHTVFFPPYASGTIWYTYDVPPTPPGKPRRSIGLTTYQTAPDYPLNGGAGDTRIAMYYAPTGDCSILQQVACGDNYSDVDQPYRNYGSVGYTNPPPGRYYIQLGTTGDVNRGHIALQVVDNKCQAKKKLCVSKKVDCLLKCRMAGANSTPADVAACIAKCATKFDGGPVPAKGCLAKVEAHGGCFKIAQTSALETKSDNFVDSTVTALITGTSNTCWVALTKCVQTKVKALLKCHANAEKKGIPVDLVCIQKAQSKFNACFAKAVPNCSTSATANSIETQVDAYVDDVACEIDPAYCP